MESSVEVAWVTSKWILVDFLGEQNIPNLGEFNTRNRWFDDHPFTWILIVIATAPFNGEGCIYLRWSLVDLVVGQINIASFFQRKSRWNSVNRSCCVAKSCINEKENQKHWSLWTFESDDLSMVQLSTFQDLIWVLP